MEGEGCSDGVCCVCVCESMRSGGWLSWWMTSPLRETFPQPAHKEGRQKVKRTRKNRNLTQCVKEGRRSTEERLADEKMLVSEVGGGSRVAFSGPVQTLVIQSPRSRSAESPHLPPFSLRWRFLLQLLTGSTPAPGGKVLCTATTGQRPIPGIAPCGTQKTGFRSGTPPSQRPSLIHGLL